MAIIFSTHILAESKADADKKVSDKEAKENSIFRMKVSARVQIW